jgi:hypothetical protein
LIRRNFNRPNLTFFNNLNGAFDEYNVANGIRCTERSDTETEKA